MKVANPPIFTLLHVAAIVSKAAEEKPPCLVVCYKPSSSMLTIASVIEDGIIHWTNSGPIPRADIGAIAESFRVKQKLAADKVPFFNFDSSKIVHLSSTKYTKH